MAAKAVHSGCLLSRVAKRVEEIDRLPESVLDSRVVTAIESSASENFGSKLVRQPFALGRDFEPIGPLWPESLPIPEGAQRDPEASQLHVPLVIARPFEAIAD